MAGRNSKGADTKQRALWLSDPAYDLVKGYGDRLGLSYSAGLNSFIMLHADELRGTDPKLVEAKRQFQGIDVVESADAPPGGEFRQPRTKRGPTILPPDATSTFEVRGDRVEHRRSRRDNTTSELPARGRGDN